MMKCRGYIFLITSGQMPSAPLSVRFDASVHRLICKRCRTFTHNDKQLDTLLETCREELQQADVGDTTEE